MEKQMLQERIKDANLHQIEPVKSWLESLNSGLVSERVKAYITMEIFRCYPDLALESYK